ncbi:cyclin-L2 isoform X2 [Calonectris borealis]|uniref:cyclin-L2 isoform X2 n=1 Tax=Calonectris borealis TaxID=1323832 RepID=UPI003F4C08CA
MAAGSGSAAAVVAVGGSGPAGPQAAGALAAGSGPAGSGAPVAGPGAVLIGDRLYSGVLITLENCLLPEHTLRFTPSMSSGLDPDTETELRVTGCELIQAAGILLRLPQVAMATGQVLFQRFFYTKSFVKHSMEHVSMACVHLASKIEEAPRRIRDVINVFHRLRHLREKKKPVPLILDQEYVNLKNQIIKAERRVLKELGFCVHVKHPHKIIVMYLQVLECERNQHLVQTSWNYMNDSLRTDVFVRFQPESIACACIYLAARTLEIPLPNRPHWFLLFGATEEEIQEICLKILQLYTRKKVDLSDLESKVEKKKLAIEEAKAQAKGLVPEGAPSLDNTSGFSPIPKNAFRKEEKAEVEVEVEIKVIQDLHPGLHPLSTGRVKVTPHQAVPNPTAVLGAAVTLLQDSSTTVPATKVPRSRSRERSDHSGKYKKKSHYYRNHRHERSRSYERASHRYDRDHPGHSRHRR